MSTAVVATGAVAGGWMAFNGSKTAALATASTALAVGNGMRLHALRWELELERAGGSNE